MKFLYEIVYTIVLDKEFNLPTGNIIELNRIYSEKIPENTFVDVCKWKLERQFMKIDDKIKELPIEGVSYVPFGKFLPYLNKEPIICNEYRRIDIKNAFTYESDNYDDLDIDTLFSHVSMVFEKVYKIFADAFEKFYKHHCTTDKMIQKYQKFLPKQKERNEEMKQNSDDFIKQFENDQKGIFQPIRAYVFEHSVDDDCNECALEKMLSVMKKGETNAIVGYFAAANNFDPANARKTIGFSIVDPSDYFIGNMDMSISKVRSASFCLSENKTISGAMLSQNHCICGEDVIYVFIDSIKEQYDRFVDRCNRYFKKEMIYFVIKETFKQERKTEMSKHAFYDISTKSKIEAEVVEKVNASKDGRKTFILKGKTPEGKKLTAMVSEKVFNEIQIG